MKESSWIGLKKSLLLLLVSNYAHVFIFETSHISSFLDAGVLPKPILIELHSTK